MPNINFVYTGAALRSDQLASISQDDRMSGGYAIIKEGGENHLIFATHYRIRCSLA